MPLILTANLHDGESQSSPLQARFDQAGGSVGRGSSNHFVLPDASHHVSRMQGMVLLVDDHFVFEQRGQNSIKHNKRTLRTGERVKLSPGDRLIVGPYTITVDFEHDTLPSDATLFGRGPVEPQAGVSPEMNDETQFRLPSAGEIKAQDPLPEPALRAMQEVTIDSTMAWRIAQGHVQAAKRSSAQDEGATASSNNANENTPMASHADPLQTEPNVQPAPIAPVALGSNASQATHNAIDVYAAPEPFARGLMAGLGFDETRLPEHFDAALGHALGDEIRKQLQEMHGANTNNPNWLERMTQLAASRLTGKE